MNDTPILAPDSAARNEANLLLTHKRALRLATRPRKNYYSKFSEAIQLKKHSRLVRKLKYIEEVLFNAQGESDAADPQS